MRVKTPDGSMCPNGGLWLECWRPWPKKMGSLSRDCSERSDILESYLEPNCCSDWSKIDNLPTKGCWQA